MSVHSLWKVSRETERLSNMKNSLCLLSLLPILALASFAGNENAAVRSVSYHGQFLDALTGAPATFAPGTTKNLEFIGYGDAAGSEKIWSTVVQGVPVNPDGSFETAFGDMDLAGHIATGKVTHVGMKLFGAPGSGIGSPRALSPVVSVNRVLVAEGLAADAKIGTVTTKAATANLLDVASAEIAGPMNVSGKDGNVSVRPFALETGVTTIGRGQGVKVWGMASNLCTRVASAGAVLWNAPADGVAVIHCVSTNSAAISVPGVIQFCRKDDEIKMPAGLNEEVSVTFWGYAQ